MTFEFGHLLDPIGHQQVHGEARSAPADAAAPAPAGSVVPSRSSDDWGAQAGELDADAWLLDLLTESERPAEPAGEDDPTPLELPRPAPGTQIPGLPEPGRPVTSPVPSVAPPAPPPAVPMTPALTPAPAVPAEPAPVVPTPVPASVAAAAPIVPTPAPVVAPSATAQSVVAPPAAGQPGATADAPASPERSRFAASNFDDDRLPVRRRKH